MSSGSISGGGVPIPVIRGLTAALAVAALVGFLAVSVYGSVQTAKASSSLPSLNSAYLYVTAALSALIGGIVAVFFGQKPVVDASGSRAQRSFASLGSGVAIRVDVNVGYIIGSAYAILYCLVGLAAIVVWVAESSVAADSVKALASTFIGLAIPIVQGYFS